MDESTPGPLGDMFHNFPRLPRDYGMSSFPKIKFLRVPEYPTLAPDGVWEKPGCELSWESSFSEAHETKHERKKRVRSS